MKGWYGNKQAHLLASKGIKTNGAYGKKWESDRNERINWKISKLDPTSIYYDPDFDPEYLDEEFEAHGFTKEQVQYLARLEKYAHKYDIDIFVGKINGNEKDTFRITYNGKEVIFDLYEMGDEKEVKSFFRNIENAETVVQGYLNSGSDDVFYDSIYRSSERSMGKSAGRHLGYSYIVDRLRNSGISVHS